MFEIPDAAAHFAKLRAALPRLAVAFVAMVTMAISDHLGWDWLTFASGIAAAAAIISGTLILFFGPSYRARAAVLLLAAARQVRLVFHPEARAALALLQRVPGPSPWYLGFPASTLTDEGDKPYSWVKSGFGDPAQQLRDPAGGVVAVLGTYCYVDATRPGLLVTWWKSAENQALAVWRTRDLRPLEDIVRAKMQLSEEQRFCASTAPLAALTLPTDLAVGCHTIGLPEALSGLGELIFTVTARGETRRKLSTRLWILDTNSGMLRVEELSWFNASEFDLGYQWIARVARDPGRGLIVADGFRLGVFNLSADSVQWLLRDPFYFPKKYSL